MGVQTLRAAANFGQQNSNPNRVALKVNRHGQTYPLLSKLQKQVS